jgi:hypothetical protein
MLFQIVLLRELGVLPNTLGAPQATEVLKDYFGNSVLAQVNYCFMMHYSIKYK